MKTPTCNLRVEIPSRFRQLENQKYLRPPLGEDDRENNSAHSWLGKQFCAFLAGARFHSARVKLRQASMSVASPLIPQHQTFADVDFEIAAFRSPMRARPICSSSNRGNSASRLGRNLRVGECSQRRRVCWAHPLESRAQRYRELDRIVDLRSRCPRSKHPHIVSAGLTAAIVSDNFNLTRCSAAFMECSLAGFLRRPLLGARAPPSCAKSDHLEQAQ